MKLKHTKAQAIWFETMKKCLYCQDRYFKKKGEEDLRKSLFCSPICWSKTRELLKEVKNMTTQMTYKKCAELQTKAFQKGYDEGVSQTKEDLVEKIGGMKRKILYADMGAWSPGKAYEAYNQALNNVLQSLSTEREEKSG